MQQLSWMQDVTLTVVSVCSTVLIFFKRQNEGVTGKTDYRGLQQAWCEQIVRIAFTPLQDLNTVRARLPSDVVWEILSQYKIKIKKK